MTPSFILDCSVAASWLFHEEDTEELRRIRRRLIPESALVPAHWHLEVANVLVLSERKSRVSAEAAAEFIDTLESLSIDTDELRANELFQFVLPLCRRHRLTSYDAVYLELALRTGLPLATLDAELRTAATAEGVTLLGL